MANVASVYSKALFNSVKDSASSDRIAAELKDFSDLCRASLDLRKVLCSSLFDSATRGRVAEEVAQKMKAAEITTRFVSLLAKKNRLSDLPAILTEFGKIRDRERGVVRGHLRAAVEISTLEAEELATSLSRRIGKRVELSAEIDTSLLGGFIVDVDGKTFDSSLRTQLRNLKEICTV